MEKPIVATHVGGVRGLLGDTGMLVPPRSSGDLAAAMRTVMQWASGDRAHMGQSARKRILQSFNIDSRIDEWEFLYNSVLNRTN